jgi:hypothetical protein
MGAARKSIKEKYQRREQGESPREVQSVRATFLAGLFKSDDDKNDCDRGDR